MSTRDVGKHSLAVDDLLQVSNERARSKTVVSTASIDRQIGPHVRAYWASSVTTKIGTFNNRHNFRNTSWSPPISTLRASRIADERWRVEGFQANG